MGCERGKGSARVSYPRGAFELYFQIPLEDVRSIYGNTWKSAL
jgi:hypothetical protein